MHLNLYHEIIWLFKTPVNFKKSIDGLSNIIIEEFIDVDINKGIFIFYNKGKDKVKILSWHKNGFILNYKRIEEGKFKFSFDVNNCSKAQMSLIAEEVDWLLAGLEWQNMSQWGELNYKKFS